MVSTIHQGGKGTDVNVASHLLMDVLEQRVDTAAQGELRRLARYPVLVSTYAEPGTMPTRGRRVGQRSLWWWAPRGGDLWEAQHSSATGVPQVLLQDGALVSVVIEVGCSSAVDLRRSQ
jgi:hypothetical protein